VDALALSADGQVLAAYRNLTGDGPRAHATKVNAIVFARSGSDALKKVEEGHLVLCRGFSLTPTDKEAPDRRAMASRRARVVSQLLSGGPADGAALGDAGAMYLAADDFAAAERSYRRALRTGRQAHWLTGLALAQAGAGDVEQALVTFSEVLDTWPDYLPAYRHLERLLRLLDKPALIVSMYRNGMARRPDLLALRLDLARFYLSAGQPETAAALLDDAPSDPISMAHTARLRADIALRTGDPKKAAAFCRQYLDAFPNAPRAAELRLFIARHRNAAEKRDGHP
jgi:tetratricopeptide (TPR) repeat protein